MYTAVVLDKKECFRLISRLEEMADWDWHSCYYYYWQAPDGKPLPHHLTLNLGGIDGGLNNPSVVGKVAELTVDAFCWNHDLGVCAARVTKMVTEQEELKSTNAQPHITMCLKPGIKPFESNNLDWDQAFLLDTPLTVNGIVSEED